MSGHCGPFCWLFSKQTFNPITTVKRIGLPPRRSAFAELTAASLMAVGLWAAAVGVLLATRSTLNAVDAGALLLALTWAWLSARLGQGAGQSRRLLVVNLLGCTLLLGLYQLALLLGGG